MENILIMHYADSSRDTIFSMKIWLITQWFIYLYLFFYHNLILINNFYDKFKYVKIKYKKLNRLKYTKYLKSICYNI